MGNVAVLYMSSQFESAIGGFEYDDILARQQLHHNNTFPSIDLLTGMPQEIYLMQERDWRVETLIV